MHQYCYGKKGVTLLLGALLLCAPQAATAGVDVGVHVNIGPPPVVVREPPAVVLVPQSRVYFVPGVDFEVFFYDGYWWSPRGDRWYRSRAYDGPWRTIERRHVPSPVFRVPRDYRARYVRERHVPYGQWKKEHRRHEGRDRREHEGPRERRERHEREDSRGRGERGEHGRGHGR